MDTAIGILIAISLQLIGIAVVVGCSRLLLLVRQWSLPIRLVSTYSLFLGLFVAAFFTGVVDTPRPPFDDLYGPYYVVPGFLMYWLSSLYSQQIFHSLLPVMSDHAASIFVIIVYPAITSGFLGGLIWYLIGKAVERRAGLIKR
jgi:hypothetical protein